MASTYTGTDTPSNIAKGTGGVTVSSAKTYNITDDFSSALSRFFDGLAKRRGLLVVIAILLAAIGAGTVLWSERQESRTAAGQNALYEAHQALDSELKAITVATEAAKAPADTAAAKTPATKTVPPKPGRAEADSATFQKFDVEQKLPEAVKKFTSVADTYSGTRAGFEAKLDLGDLYFNHGDAAKALPWYQKAVDSAPGNFEKSLAWSALAYAQENIGHNKDAVDAFQKALNLGEPAVKGDALLGIARNYEGLHDVTQARSTYDQIISQLPNTEYSRTAESRKALLH